MGLLLVVAVGAGAGLWWYLQQQETLDLAAIRRAAEDAMAAGDHQAALEQFQELADAGGKSDEVAYRMALCEEALGSHEAANQAMHGLANAGHVSAHWWLAQQLKAKGKMSREETQEYERHLNAVVEDDPQNLEAHRLLGELAIHQGNLTMAAKHLERTATSNDQERLRLAKLYALTHHPDQAVPLGREALDGFLEQVNQHPDDLPARIKAMDAAVLLGDFSQAEQVLVSGLKQPKVDQQKLQASLSNLYALWAINVARRTNDAGALVMRLLTRSADYSPVSSETYPALRDLMLRTPELRDRGRTELLKALSRENVSPSLIHMLLADLANAAGQTEEAQRHWLLAAQSDPRAVAPLNNLAISLITDSSSNARLALLLIERAITINPQMPALHATRGRVLVKLRRWEEAQEELSAVLHSMSKSSDVRLALAEVYTQRGFPELADEHVDNVLQRDPSQHLAVARIVARGKDQDRAKARVAEAVAYYRELSNETPDNLEARLAWAEALAIGRQHAEAIDMLKAAQTDPPKPLIEQALVRHFLVWARADDTRQAGGEQKRLERIQQALKHDPENRGALMYLIGTARGNSPLAPAAKKSLDAMLAVEHPPAELLFLMGTRDWLDGNQASSRKWYERALQADPDVPDLRNNLAWALVHSEPEDPPRALQLAEEALARSPNRPNYHGTRAHALARLGRWEDAKADLEYALRFETANEDNRKLQQEIYRHLRLAPPQQPAVQKK